MEKKTRVIAVANQKGGVGKTTTVVNLAAALSKMHRTVLVVDLDPQASATSGLGLERQDGVSLYPILLGEGSVADVIQPTVYDNLNVIPSEVNLSGAEIEIARREDRITTVRRALQEVRASNAFDYILIDCPPSLGVVMTASLAAADGVIVPMQAEFLALEGLGLITNLIDRLKNSVNPGLELNGILMTMVNMQARLTHDVIDEVRKHFGGKLFETMIPRNVRTSEAPSFGQPVVFYDPSSKGAQAYKAFAKEFVVRNPTRFESAPEPASEPPAAPVEPAPAEPAAPVSAEPASVTGVAQ